MTTSERAARERLDTVLVPTDFSEGAKPVLARALMLPLAPGARVHVVHVLPADLPANIRSEAEAEARTRLERVLSNKRKTVKTAGELNLTSDVLHGEAFVEIIRCSRSIDTDLIVIGRHGRRPIRDMLIGTTAERVIRMGDVPTLAVNRKPTGPYRRPLIATALGDAARGTINMALRVVGPEVENINVVHAFNVPFESLITPSVSERENSDNRRQFEVEAVADLTECLKSYQDLGLRWKTAVLPGDARSVILGEAQRRRADLIAVGTHGRSGIAHALVGSVANWIITSAACDVLVARLVRFSFEPP
jgi:nucleotide-binding universal stress UspA family protein